MKVVLFNQEEIIISQEEADSIDQMIESGINWIKIGEYRVRPSAIALIKPGGSIEPDRPRNPQLMEPEPVMGGGYAKYKAKRKELGL